MHRVVQELQWAQRAEVAPWPKARARGGSKGQGLRYEREVGRHLEIAEHGSWFKFRDLMGVGYCQPDFLIVGKNQILVIECKYTWLPEGHTQIEQLYRPVLEKALGMPVIGFVCCKRLVSSMPMKVKITSTLREAVKEAQIGQRVAFHWIGQQMAEAA